MCMCVCCVHAQYNVAFIRTAFAKACGSVCVYVLVGAQWLLIYHLAWVELGCVRVCVCVSVD